MSSTLDCKSIDFTGVTHAPTISGSSDITVAGAVTLVSGLTWSSTGDLYCKPDVMTCSLIAAGHAMSNVLRITGGTTKWTVNDNFALGGAVISGTNNLVDLDVPNRTGSFAGDVFCFPGFTAATTWNWADSDITINGHYLSTTSFTSACKITHTNGILRLIGGTSNSHKTAMPGNNNVASNEVHVSGHYDFGRGVAHAGMAKLYLGANSSVSLGPNYGPWRVTNSLDDLGPGWTLQSTGGSGSPAGLILTNPATLAYGTVAGIDASSGAAITCTCCTNGGGNSNVTFAACPTSTPTQTPTNTDTPTITETPTETPTSGVSHK